MLNSEKPKREFLRLLPKILEKREIKQENTSTKLERTYQMPLKELLLKKRKLKKSFSTTNQ